MFDALTVNVTEPVCVSVLDLGDGILIIVWFAATQGVINIGQLVAAGQEIIRSEAVIYID